MRLGKKYEYPVPTEVHRGCVHPGKAYTPLNLYFGTVHIFSLLLDSEFIHLWFESISEAKDS